ncbi:MAG: bifunctional 3-deoxy-7-phosphoheptulonate synthase/chorismate mutase [Calditrichia bacterium]|nr:bifunctional 3-deoxy-7-phosphoheptulonate synthase/chorismate mutase [Calditrichia bacterium]
MLISFLESATKNQIDSVLEYIHSSGNKSQFVNNGNSKTLILLQSENIDIPEIESMQGIKTVKNISASYKLASREGHPNDTIINIDGNLIGEKDFSLIAGPCSVENEKQIFQIAEFLVENNIKFLRGGAFKPRTSPYSFQGLGIEGLKLLGKVKQETGLIIVSEAMDIVAIDQVAEYVDIIQIGSRSMQNFPLLKKAGELKKPVLLKRGFSAKIEEFLLSAEYILSEGNDQVILCERGIRSFNDHSRNMLDIAAIPVINELTHLPLIVDPSHASGKRNLVLPLSKAALVAGSNGLLIEIHPEPEKALSDGIQSLSFNEFRKLKSELTILEQALKQEISN